MGEEGPGGGTVELVGAGELDIVASGRCAGIAIDLPGGWDGIANVIDGVDVVEETSLDMERAGSEERGEFQAGGEHNTGSGFGRVLHGAGAESAGGDDGSDARIKGGRIEGKESAVGEAGGGDPGGVDGWEREDVVE